MNPIERDERMATHILTTDEVAVMDRQDIVKEIAWQQAQYGETVRSGTGEAINSHGENLTLLGIRLSELLDS